MHSLFTWVAGIALVMATAFGGGLASGERIRANYSAEGAEDRAWRLKATWVCLGVAVVSGLLAWATS